jgi:hypothetical protein
MKNTVEKNWYEKAVTLLDCELEEAKESVEDLSVPQDAVVKRAKEFLSALNGITAEVPVIVISHDGDVNLKWGRGREALFASFCYDGLDHYSHRNETIERDQIFDVLREMPMQVAP